ncbi:RadC family protein [Desulfospira joergensenii]|uniref:RadC family protein n=1 Tax=Desulfospira joergensenii TaxID=53329 RepID=UPI000684F6BE|nr:DNA repair protein RadC [Desulfospira joergensenii]
MKTSKMKESRQTRPHKGQGHRKRLRERFLSRGLEGFHDYEVIELLLSLNTPRRDCKDTAKALLKSFKTLQGVVEADLEALCRVPGVGPVNAMGIRLVKAAADRYLEAKILSRDVVSQPRDLLDYLDHAIGFKGREYFVGVFLDAKNRVLACETLFEGSLTTSSVYPREVIARALHHRAAAMIFAHNHPSGDVSPSESDIRITRRLCFALNYADIRVHEHMIVGNHDYFSFASENLISRFNEEFQKNNE